MDELDRVRAMAWISVGRACAFGMLAIAMVSFSLVAWPHIAFKLAALGCTLATAILVLKGERAPRTSYKSTEVWIMLERHVDVPEAHVHRLITGALQDTYRQFALAAAALATGFWLLALVAWLFHTPRVLT
jgi:hypothetical protein